MGDVAKGFAEADVIVEREFDTKPMHQGYIEPQGCVASATEDGQIELWCCTQAPWVYRDRLSNILKIDTGQNPRPAVGNGRRLRRQDRVLSASRSRSSSRARPSGR